MWNKWWKSNVAQFWLTWVRHNFYSCYSIPETYTKPLTATVNMKILGHAGSMSGKRNYITCNRYQVNFSINRSNNLPYIADIRSVLIPRLICSCAMHYLFLCMSACVVRWMNRQGFMMKGYYKFLCYIWLISFNQIKV